MQGVLKADEVEQSTVPNHGHDIHGAKWEGNPDVHVLQPWDPTKNQGGWGQACFIQQQHDHLRIVFQKLWGFGLVCFRF